MRDSTTYQAILEEGRQEGRQEGRLEGSRLILLRSGRRRFGEPSREIISMIDAIADVEVLEELIEQIGDVGNWNDLMALMPVGS